jgi:hypothetical protein
MSEFYVGKHPGLWVGPVIKDKATNHPVAFVAAGSEHFSDLLSLAPEMLEALRKILHNVQDGDGSLVVGIAEEILGKAARRI